MVVDNARPDFEGDFGRLEPRSSAFVTFKCANLIAARECFRKVGSRGPIVTAGKTAVCADTPSRPRLRIEILVPT